MAERSPADIARDTLRLLAARRLPPTPSNYQAIYEEVAGLLPQIAFPSAPLRRIASLLPTQTATQKRIARDFAQAVEQQDWGALQAAIADYARIDVATHTIPVVAELPESVRTVEHLSPALAEQLARVIEHTAQVLGEEDTRMLALTDALTEFLRASPPSLAALEPMLHHYSYRLSFTTDDQAQRRHSMHDLLRMVCEHILSIAEHDPALQRQAQYLSSALAEPWTLPQLDTIQQHLKSLLFRHLEIEGQRQEAHSRLKDLLAEHANQMLNLGRMSSRHAQALSACAERIQQAQDLGDLTPVLQAVVDSGSALATENRIVQAQLQDLRAQNEAQEHTITQLAGSLQLVADSTRHDPYTGALNLQGLHETLNSEAARTQRQPQPISLAMLQLDQLEQLHAAGGNEAMASALRHVTRLLRGTLRPQDALARIDEVLLAIVMPNTHPDQATQAVQRLQAELAARPLLLEDDKLTLSFSAGIIQVQREHSASDAVAQVIQATRQAHQRGTGQVFRA